MGDHELRAMLIEKSENFTAQNRGQQDEYLEKIRLGGRIDD